MTTPRLARPGLAPPRLAPQMAHVLERIRRAGHRPLHALAPHEARRVYEAAAEVLEPPRPKLARVEDIRLPGADGMPLRARVYAPSGERLPTLLYLHGGGFVVGSVDTHDALCRQLSARSGAAVVSLDYRLAPEHRFPTAADDAWAALRWLAADRTLGLDTARLAVGGDSAGGTLAAVAALHARDEGLPLALQLLITPGTAAHADTDSHRRFAEGYLIEAAHIAWFFDHYIDRHERTHWRFAPLLADDHGGLAPAMVLLAEADPLVDEGIAYADRLRASGVPVELELVRGVTHDFIKMGRALPQALDAQQAAADALKRTLFE